ncbi:MAG: hypothetical protein CMO34_02480 [Verrucomicrobia bacterium]|nr:hypothetical protein [Verrucomicrobiota bacterium]
MIKKHCTYLLLILFLLACRTHEEDRIISVYPLDEFHTVQFNSSFDILLMEDSVFAIEIDAPESVFKHIDFKIEEGILSLTNTKRLKWTAPKNSSTKLLVRSKPLKLVEVNESCNIKNLNPITSEEFGLVLGSKANNADLMLNCNTFYYWNNFPSGGRLKLSGNSKTLKLWNTAIMSVDARELLCEFALVENSSQGNCVVNVSRQLEYKIENVGDIHLYGKPDIIESKGSTASGKLIIF